MRILKGLLLFFISFQAYAAIDAQQLFKKYADRVYQVQVIDRESGNKSAIGSAFQVRADGLLATNYHVISEAALYPDKYRIEYVGQDAKKGKLVIEDIDVVNDLALVRRQSKRGAFLKLARRMPRQGKEIFSLGNPLDLGSSVVPGTYNGYIKKNFYQRLHFTGGINSGMSGGPVVNRRGEVIGINVATAGNQVGFLVPMIKLKSLMEEYDKRGKAPENIYKRMRQQLLKNQENMISRMFAVDWKTVKLGKAKVLGEVFPFIQCWGGSNSNKKRPYLTVSRVCRSNGKIFLASGFRTGQVEYEYSWVESRTLNSLRFYRYIQRLLGSASPAHASGKQHVSNFECHESYVSGPKRKAVFCARAYKKFEGLFDVLYIDATVDKNHSALMSHFTLAGVSKESALKFLKRFMGSR